MRDLQEDSSERPRAFQLRLLSLFADPHFPAVGEHIRRGFPKRGTREVPQFVILSSIPCPRSTFEVQEGQFGHLHSVAFRRIRALILESYSYVVLLELQSNESDIENCIEDDRSNRFCLI
jgi:hypothetical protein